MTSRGGPNAQHDGCKRLKTEILIQMDGLLKSSDRVFVLAASNLPWELDNALLRRLEKRIYVPLPDKKAREGMLRNMLPPKKANALNYEEYADKLDLYSGSDIKCICKEASMRPLRKILHRLEYEGIQLKPDTQPDPVENHDVDEACKQVRPSPSLGHKAYSDWFEKYGSY